MPQARKADVALVVCDVNTTTMRCLESLLLHSGPVLGRLFVVDISGHQAHSRELSQLAGGDARVRLLRTTGLTGEVEASNLGIQQRIADIVLIRSDVEITSGWLAELAEVAYLDPRTACTFPIISQQRLDSQPDGSPDVRFENDEATVRSACADLPRCSVAPAPDVACCYLRGDVLDAVGLLDPAYSFCDHALVDWHMKAQALGFLARRANRAFVRRTTSGPSLNRSPSVGQSSSSLLAQRHPQLQPRIDRFKTTLDWSMPDHAIQLVARGTLRVACDLRPLPREQVGTRTYAVSLVTALAAIPEIELTLLVREPSQARGLKGRVVTPETWEDDVTVIHRPMQIIDPRDLKLLYESSAHLVVTYQDLIGYQIPLVFPTDAEHLSYRATSSLSLQGIQRILAYSKTSAREIVEEFGVPPEDVVVVPLGADANWFSSVGPRDSAIHARLQLPDRYFFSVATDFPHKNLPCLLQAYASFRGQWTQGVPPSLVLAGYTTGARNGFYQQLVAEMGRDGVIFLGSVTPDQLRVLYQRSEALIFPSLYEGFGLPPLEAMAAGVPVIAMPISSMPEVGGDSVLYPDSLSSDALARAMRQLLEDDQLRATLRARGAERVRQFCWERTARLTLDAYRSAVLRPSARSLAMRRRLREAVLNWSASVVSSTAPTNDSGTHPIIGLEPLGIRNASKALLGAIQTRLRREAMRLNPGSGRRASAVKF
jgi:glycosyltransferase involved in cell wall biosynthesis